MSALLTAAVDAIEAAHTGTPRIYEVNKVPAGPTYPYSVVDVVPQAPVEDAYTLDRTHGPREYRVDVQHFGRDNDGVSDYHEKADTALLDQILTADGYSCDPCRHLLTTKRRDPDDSGVIGVTAAYAFMATKET